VPVVHEPMYVHSVQHLQHCVHRCVSAYRHTFVVHAVAHVCVWYTLVCVYHTCHKYAKRVVCVYSTHACVYPTCMCVPYVYTNVQRALAMVFIEVPVTKILSVCSGGGEGGGGGGGGRRRSLGLSYEVNRMI